MISFMNLKNNNDPANNRLLHIVDKDIVKLFDSMRRGD